MIEPEVLQSENLGFRRRFRLIIIIGLAFLIISLIFNYVKPSKSFSDDAYETSEKTSKVFKNKHVSVGGDNKGSKVSISNSRDSDGVSERKPPRLLPGAANADFWKKKYEALKKKANKADGGSSVEKKISPSTNEDRARVSQSSSPHLLPGIDDAYFRKYYQHFATPGNVNCRGVYDNVTAVVKPMMELAQKEKYHGLKKDEDWFIEKTKNCKEYLDGRGYITSPLSKEEEEFPLAFSMIVYKDTEQVERLLRTIYRPQNHYCIHLDGKRNETHKMRLALEGIARCLPNVFMAENPIRVAWGTWSVIQVELICMAQLLQKGRKWRYFLNLTGQEFPLMANFHIVQALRAFNGANEIQALPKRRASDLWGRFQHMDRHPFKIVVRKGSLHSLISRGFVEKILTDKNALKFTKWLRKAIIPDELLLPTLNNNEFFKMPGGLSATRANMSIEKLLDQRPFFARYKKWLTSGHHNKCYGKNKRGICVLGTGDLTELKSRQEFFINKIDMSLDRLAYSCMEQHIFNMTWELALGKWHPNTTVYAQSPQVLYQLQNVS